MSAPALSASISGFSLSSSVSVYVSGGSPPYTVTVDGLTSTGSGNIFNFSSLPSGSFSAAVTDSVGASVTTPAVSLTSLQSFTSLPANNSSVSSFFSGVVQDMGVMFPVSVGVMSAVLGIALVPRVVKIFWS